MAVMRLFLLLFAALPLIAWADTPVAQSQSPHPIPPRYLYHVGSKDYLMQDALAHEIPPSSWDTNIMGKGTRFNLPPRRRGLYGTEKPTHAAFYGDGLIGSGATPWMIQIEIDESCLQPDRVAPEGATILSVPAFTPWAEAHVTELGFKDGPEWRQKCVTHNSKGELLYDDGPEYDQSDDTPCGAVITAYMDAAKVGVVYDDADRSGLAWYIRDRACVKSIRGAPHELAEAMSDPESWNGYPDEYGSDTEFSIISQVLADASVTADDARKMAKALHDSQRIGEYGPQPRDYWSADGKMITEFLACSAKGRVSRFRADVTRLLTAALAKRSEKEIGEGGFADGAVEGVLKKVTQDCGT
jgi:hypothetical protein